MELSMLAPQAITAGHQLAHFDCGEASLNDWLKRRALSNHQTGASRCFVVADLNGLVMGYYALSAGAVSHAAATGPVKRNMPEPVPVLVLGRLAVDLKAQGQRLGAAMLQDAVKRALAVAQDAGVRALLVHALNAQALAFYQRYGFQVSPLEPMTLMLRLPTPTSN